MKCYVDSVSETHSVNTEYIVTILNQTLIRLTVKWRIISSSFISVLQLKIGAVPPSSDVEAVTDVLLCSILVVDVPRVSMSVVVWP